MELGLKILFSSLGFYGGFTSQSIAHVTSVLATKQMLDKEKTKVNTDRYQCSYKSYQNEDKENWQWFIDMNHYLIAYFLLIYFLFCFQVVVFIKLLFVASSIW